MPAEKILIVEDEKTIADVMKLGLERLGYSLTETAATGEEAIRIAERYEPDLVLMDVHLQGGMDGIDAAAHITGRYKIPVIFITGDMDDRLLEKSKQAEPLGFLAKPFSIKELQSVIVTSLNHYHSERNRNRKALQIAELRYRNLFENAIQGIFRVAQSGKFIDVNASFAEMMGYSSPEEFVESAGDAKQCFVLHERHRELLNLLKQSGYVKDFEFQAVRKDGSKIWQLQSIRTIQDSESGQIYYEGIVQDITERKYGEGALKSLLARQTALLAAIPDIIMEVDNNNVCTWANNTGMEFFGEDVIGKNREYYCEGYQDVRGANDVCLHKSGPLSYVENRQRRKDGQIRLLAWWRHELKDGKGAVVGELSSARDITDSRRAEEALRQSEDRFRMIAEHIDEVFWLSDVDSQKVIYVSPAFKRVWGFSGDNLYDSLDCFIQAIHCDDRQRVINAFALQKHGKPVEVEYRIVRPNGSIRHIWDRCFPIIEKDGKSRRYVGVAQDVTEWRQAEEDLKKSKEYLNRIINSIGDPIFVKDRQHRFLMVNDANCDFTGISREKTIGNTLAERLAPDLTESFFKQEDLVFETGKPHISIDDMTTSNGRQYTVMAKKALLKDESGNEQLVGIIRDITDIKKAENARAEMEIQLRQAQKLEAIGQLAAGIAHEINTPTQYVGDNAHFLKDAFTNLLKVLEAYRSLFDANRCGTVPPKLLAEVEDIIGKADLEYFIDEIPKALTQSLEGLERVSTIVRAMKEFSHPGEEEKQAVDLNHAIANTVTVCRNEWKYVAEMDMDLDPALPLVPCLPGDFNQVILNLIINAAHAIADSMNGGDKRKGTIRISTRYDNQRVEIRIGDTGTGIPEKYRAKIFTPFFTTKGVGRGTGQGLAISRSVIVGKHGGTIDYETELGKGTVFIIRLPMRAVSIQ